MSDNPFRQIPSVNEVLAVEQVQVLLASHAHEQIVGAIRVELDDLRGRLANGEAVDGQAQVADIACRVSDRLQKELRPKLRLVINATGIVLHTNLARAPIAEEPATPAPHPAPPSPHPHLHLTT